MPRVTLLAALMGEPSTGGQEILALPDAVQWLEVRADLTPPIDPAWLRARFPGSLLYSFHSRAEGGGADVAQTTRRRRLLDAADHYDLIELESDRDLIPEILNRIEPWRRVIAWHGAATGLAELRSRWERLADIPARLYKLTTCATQASDGIAPLALLKSLGRADVVAFATGQAGIWSRPIAPLFGAPWVYGTVAETSASGGEPTIARLIEDYGFPDLAELREIYGIVGSPVGHSLSPRLHNAAYRFLGHPALFLPFHTESLQEFWRQLVEVGKFEELGLSIRGLTVASPHKEAAVPLAGSRSEMVRRANSTNLITRTNGTWNADTTDPEGVLENLRQRGIPPEQCRAAVIGCGGSGRAIAAALDQAGAQVTLINRGLERGQLAVSLLGLPFVPLTEWRPEGFDLIVNATPVGRDNAQLPFEVGRLCEAAVVVDLVYGADPTPLIECARALGKTAIDGRDVLLTQVLRQFRLMTGRIMPTQIVREILDTGIASSAARADSAIGTAES